MRLRVWATAESEQNPMTHKIAVSFKHVATFVLDMMRSPCPALPTPNGPEKSSVSPIAAFVFEYTKPVPYY